jgi:hypothetical protein
MVRRNRFHYDTPKRCEGCSLDTLDVSRFIADGRTYTLCSKCLERNLNARRHVGTCPDCKYRIDGTHVCSAHRESDTDELSRLASYYTP